MQFSDSLSAWDDAGITALALSASAVLIGFFAKRRPWLFGLAIGTWLPLRGIIRAHDLRFLLVLLIPLRRLLWLGDAPVRAGDVPVFIGAPKFLQE